ncbi:MAG: IS21-like element helper ATPase IstB [Bacillota bacterium]
MSNSNLEIAELEANLKYLQLQFLTENCQDLAASAAKDNQAHLLYLANLIQGEADLRRDRAVARRIKEAKFPVEKTLEQFDWSWPKKINQLQVKNLFQLHFLKAKANVIFLGGVGIGKSHLSTALAYQACLAGRSVLFCNAIDAVNTLIAATHTHQFDSSLKKFLKPDLLVLDELGYLPIDKTGADVLFQIISKRYERGSLIITSNRAYKYWSQIFNQDSTLTAAILDRLLHRAETVLIEGKSYRGKDNPEDPVA